MYHVRMSWLFDYLPNNFMYHTSGNTATGAYTWYCPSVSEKTRMTSTCINTWKHTVSLTQNEDIRTRCTPHGMHCRSGSCIQVIVKTHTMYKTRTIRWVFKNKRKIGLKHGFTVEIKKNDKATGKYMVAHGTTDYSDEHADTLTRKDL